MGIVFNRDQPELVIEAIATSVNAAETQSGASSSVVGASVFKCYRIDRDRSRV